MFLWGRLEFVQELDHGASLAMEKSEGFNEHFGST